MQILNPKLSLPTFWSQLKNTSPKALMLDFDGTLAPFSVNRNEVAIFPIIETVLSEILITGSTRMVIVSGRSIESLRTVVRLSPMPELWGSHALERLFPDGFRQVQSVTKKFHDGQRILCEWIEHEKLSPIAEIKPTGAAFHFRGKPVDEVATMRQMILDHWSKSAVTFDMEIKAYDGGLELRYLLTDKGRAVQTIREEMGDEAMIVYCGDDQTDEDAFAALDGKSLSVLVRSKPRATSADLQLTPPEELAWFLNQWKACD